MFDPILKQKHTVYLAAIMSDKDAKDIGERSRAHLLCKPSYSIVVQVLSSS
jgi:hypothetical protein